MRERIGNGIVDDEIERLDELVNALLIAQKRSPRSVLWAHLCGLAQSNESRVPPRTGGQAGAGSAANRVSAVTISDDHVAVFDKRRCVRRACVNRL
jgi:hypothetical protein